MAVPPGFIARAVLCALLAGSTIDRALAERPPQRLYTTADGLAHDRVGDIFTDSRGYVWFGTAHGLSRFDGSRFLTYGPADGLSSASINKILEAGDEYFIATNGGGVGWYRPNVVSDPAARFRMFLVDAELGAANRVNALFRDHGGRIWVGTDGGLFALERTGDSLRFVRVMIRGSARADARLHVWSLAEDSGSRLWIGTSDGLSRRNADGRLERDAVHPVQGADHVWALLVDNDSGVWAGHDAACSW